MHLHCVLMLILVVYDTLEFIVRGFGPLVVPLGGSVVLPCYTETPLVTEKLRVVWRRTDSETLVHLYEDGESRPEEQHKDYQDRAHFFTDQIQHGNFSLRLDNLTAEDKGVYRCKVYTQQFANKTFVEIKYVEYLQVSGSSCFISASVGEDVTLNCSVDSHIKPEHIEEVSWKRTDEDILVLLYQNNETFPDLSDERYRDRVEFFTDEIPKGNFSLRLKSVRTEDKGVYMCEAIAGGLSANTTVVLEQLDFYKRKLLLFGSAGLVLVNSVALMTEVIMIAVKGDRLVGDLRIVVFPSEWVFTVPLLILSIFVHWKPDSTPSPEYSHSADSKGIPATEYIEVNEKKGESHEMETLGKVAGNYEEQEEEINL